MATRGISEKKASVQEAAASAPSQEDLVAADNFDVGDVDAPKTRRKNMLNPDVGLTDLNCGRSCYLAGGSQAICVHIHTCVHIFISTHIYPYIHVNIYIFLYIHIHISM